MLRPRSHISGYPYDCTDTSLQYNSRVSVLCRGSNSSIGLMRLSPSCHAYARLESFAPSKTAPTQWSSVSWKALSRGGGSPLPPYTELAPFFGLLEKYAKLCGDEDARNFCARQKWSFLSMHGTCLDQYGRRTSERYLRWRRCVLNSEGSAYGTLRQICRVALCSTFMYILLYRGGVSHGPGG